MNLIDAQMKICRDTILLIKSIGIPGLIEGEGNLPLNGTSILHLAKLNKIPLFFLESLRKFKKHPTLEIEDSRYRDKQRKTLNLIATFSSLLEESGIHYTIFKTLKPFHYTPADIDVLIYSSKELTKASHILEKINLKPLGKDLYGLTMFSFDHDINVDLTTEVAVSGLIYLNKNLLFNHISQVKVNGFEVKTLKNYAELVMIASHCMYKEQMYMISDYYAFALSSQYYQEAFELAESTHTKFALEVALKLTYDITINAFGPDNNLIDRLKNALQTVNVKRGIQTHKCFDLPMKYPPSIMIKGVSKKLLEDPVSRKSLPTGFKSILQPKFINKLFEHMTRKGY